MNEAVVVQIKVQFLIFSEGTEENYGKQSDFSQDSWSPDRDVNTGLCKRKGRVLMIRSRMTEIQPSLLNWKDFEGADRVPFEGILQMKQKYTNNLSM